MGGTVDLDVSQDSSFSFFFVVSKYVICSNVNGRSDPISAIDRSYNDILRKLGVEELDVVVYGSNVYCV